MNLKKKVKQQSSTSYDATQSRYALHLAWADLRITYHQVKVSSFICIKTSCYIIIIPTKFYQNKHTLLHLFSVQKLAIFYHKKRHASLQNYTKCKHSHSNQLVRNVFRDSNFYNANKSQTVSNQCKPKPNILQFIFELYKNIEKNHSNKYLF